VRLIFSTTLCLVLGAGAASVAAQPSPDPSPSALPSPSATASATVPGPPAAVIDLARSRIDTMFRSGHCDAAWFSASFLAQIPASKVDEILASVKSSFGSYQSVEYAPTKFIAHFEKGTINVLIHFDADMKIDTLFFRSPVLSSLENALEAMRQPSGTLSYVILEEGRSERAALNASETLAIGSAFKLAVLNALRDEISNGRLHWNDVVALKHEWKSLPSGVLRTWPDGTPVTLATLAAEMISISDNAAADALVQIVGANALKPYAGENQPLLTTRELFTLKSVPGAELLAAYRKATSPGAREVVLRQTDSLPLPRIDELLTKPELDVEWHYSVRDLCRLLTRVADLPLVSINPGAADPAAFRNVAFKGGSDLGVVNLTTMVTTKRGTHLCFSATLNDSTREVDDATFIAAYGNALQFLEDA
jgi:beta-lactamase class A